MVRYKLGHGHPDQALDHHRGLLLLDHDPVRTVRQALKHHAFLLWHATTEEAVRNARPAPGRDSRLIVKPEYRSGCAKDVGHDRRFDFYLPYQHRWPKTFAQILFLFCLKYNSGFRILNPTLSKFLLFHEIVGCCRKAEKGR
jgi:hypothetical protein